MPDKRITGLVSDTSTVAAREALLLEVDDAAFSESKNLSVEKINEATRTGAGLDSDGAYAGHSGSNYLDAATDLHNADELLDAQAKQNADDIATLETELDSRILTKKVTLTSSNILNDLVDTIIILAKASGKIIDLMSVVAKLDYGSVDYAGGSELTIKSKSGTDMYTIDVALVTASADTCMKAHMAQNITVCEDDDLLISASALPTNGDSVIHLYLTYRYITA